MYSTEAYGQRIKKDLKEEIKKYFHLMGFCVFRFWKMY